MANSYCNNFIEVIQTKIEGTGISSLEWYLTTLKDGGRPTMVSSIKKQTMPTIWKYVAPHSSSLSTENELKKLTRLIVWSAVFNSVLATSQAQKN